MQTSEQEFIERAGFDPYRLPLAAPGFLTTLKDRLSELEEDYTIEHSKIDNKYDRHQMENASVAAAYLEGYKEAVRTITGLKLWGDVCMEDNSCFNMPLNKGF